MTFSARADVLTRRTYSRPLGDGLYESWGDTTQRVIAHQRWLWERAQGGALLESQNEELGLLYHLIFNRRALPSGRTLWLGGTEIAKRREASQFNCAAERIETVHDSVDLFWLLLQGCGVGFEPVPGLLNGFAKPIPEIQVVRSDRADKGEPDNIELWDPDSRTWGIKIGDSAEAWSKSVGKLLAGKHPADKLVIDYSEIRPAGSILSGYGWECSGDINIHRAFDAICALLNRRAGQLLSHIDILDVCNWLGTTLSSRRSAEIALYPYGAPGWEAFAAAKYEEDPENPKHWWRGQSNNSLLLRERPSRAEIDRLLDMMVSFGGSEPGLVNVAEAKRRAPWFSGLNPCAEILLANKGFCVAGTTPLITRTVCAPIAELAGREVEVWNGETWSKVTPRCTRRGARLLRVNFGDGSYLDCTEDHRFSVKNRFEQAYREVRAGELQSCSAYVVHTEPFTMDYRGGLRVEHAYTYGVVLGDGSVWASPTAAAGYAVTLDLFGVKAGLPVAGRKTVTREVNGSGTVEATYVAGLSRLLSVPRLLRFKGGDLSEVFGWDKDSILAFIAGWIDADGSNTATKGVRLYATERLCRQAQLLLTKCGYRSSVNLMQRAGASTNFGQRNRDQWYVQITAPAGIPCHRVDTRRARAASMKGKYQVIRSIEPLPGLHDVYCFEEPLRHKAVFNNTLTFQCNLSDLNVAAFDDFSSMRRAIYLLARANYRQTCVNLDDGILQRAWHENQQFFRLCGVGLTGLVRRPDLTDHDLRTLRNVAVQGAYGMAAELGLPRPKNVTTIKPSGTLSKIMDTTEGVHTPPGRYLFNKVQFAATSPLVERLRDAGYRVQPHPYDATGVLVTFPVHYPDVAFAQNRDGVHVNLEPAVDQLHRYRRLMRSYVDQNVSITVSYDRDEVPAIAEWMDRHWDDVVAVSFLPRNDPTKTAADLGYAYLPQQVVAEAEYGAYAAKLKPVDLGRHGMTGPVDDECQGGACPVR